VPRKEKDASAGSDTCLSLFGKELGKEQMIEMRAWLYELVACQGWKSFENRQHELTERQRRGFTEIRDDSFATLNRINRRCHEIEERERAAGWPRRALSFINGILKDGG